MDLQAEVDDLLGDAGAPPSGRVTNAIGAGQCAATVLASVPLARLPLVTRRFDRAAPSRAAPYRGEPPQRWTRSTLRMHAAAAWSHSARP